MSDTIHIDLVRQGRDPDWRLGWEEYLSAEARTEVEAALKQQRPVSDPLLVDYAQGLARRRLRSFRWSLALIPLHVGLVGLFIYASCFIADPPQALCWFYIGLGLVWLLVVPFLIKRRRARLEAALEANSRT